MSRGRYRTIPIIDTSLHLASLKISRAREQNFYSVFSSKRLSYAPIESRVKLVVVELVLLDPGQ